MSRPRHPAEIDATIVALSRQGLSTRRIAAEVQVSATTVARVLREMAGDPRQNDGDGRTVTAGVIAAPVESAGVSGPSVRRPLLAAVQPMTAAEHDRWEQGDMVALRWDW